MDTQQTRTREVQTAMELFADMSLRHTEPKRARRAFDQFCEEYRDRILKTSVYLCKRYRRTCPNEYAKDICQDVLLKVYLNAEKYTPEKGNPFTWIATIAKNELLSKLDNQDTFISLDELTETNRLNQRQKAKQNGSDDTSDDTETGSENVFVAEETVTNPKLEWIERILHSLPEREEDIIRTTYLFAPYRIPTRELDRIQQKYGTSRDNMKQIRKRILGKLKGLDDDDACVVV